MAAVPVCLLVVLMAVRVQTEPQCPEIGTVRKNNWAEDQDGQITSTAAPGVTGVSWAPYNTSSDFIDVSGYVDVTYNKTTQEIVFTALPAIAGARDFPAMGYPQLNQMGGFCEMTCGSNTGEFQFLLTVNDKNTATPAFASSSYSVDVLETFPVNLTIPYLVISASDADADATNNKLSFTLKGDSTFGLTQTVKTSDQPPTYTVQLVLNQQLNWSRTASYQLTVVANDPGGLSAESTVSVTVIDVDTMQPEFDQSVYSATIDDPERLGPLNVSIRADDPDSPGKLIYELQDPSGGQFAGYFSLDPDTAELALTKDISDMLEPYTRTIPFLLQATEDGGCGFSCRAELLIILPGNVVTTTTGPAPRCPDLRPLITGWPEDKTGLIVSRPAPGVTHVAWAPYDSAADYLDVSQYVDVTVNTELRTIEFTALPSMYGIVDFGSRVYPDPVLMKGTCLVECGTDRGEFKFTLYVVDGNTAHPVFSSPTYTVYLKKTFPVGLVIGNPAISASDADADPANYELSFTMNASRTFSLTDAVKTSDLLPTYTSRLRLDQPLGASRSYTNTITVQDPKGQQTKATIEVIIIDPSDHEPFDTGAGGQLEEW